MIKEDLEKILGFKVEATENSDFGDYTSNVALQFKTQKSKIKITTQNLNSRQIAEEIVDKLKNNKELTNLVDRIEIAGPGFINFWLKKDVLVSNLIQIASEKGKYGMTDSGKGKLAIVEYSSPNIAKPFGVGHLRSTVIGDAIASLLESTGYRVMRDNHLGDWGTQFGKMIYAIKTWGDEKSIEKSDKPVAELTKLYIKFHEKSEKDESLEDAARAWFKKLEDGDPEARRIWQKCVDWSWIEFNKVYELLGIKFNKDFDNGRGLGESFFETRMESVIDELNAKELLKVGEGGAKLVFFAKNKYPPAMILKKDGATLYHTRDLATDKYRLEKYNPDLIINEVGSEQSLYFQQLFEIEKLLGWFKEGARVHVGHGMYLMDGKKMSTRAGKTIQLQDVLDEAIKRAYQLAAISGGQRADYVKNADKKDLSQIFAEGIQKTNELVSDEKKRDVESVAVGAIKYFDLLHQPMTNINFDWDSMFALEGNIGPYLQYTVARTNSVLAKSTFKGATLQGDYSNLSEEELAVLRTLIRFPEVISASAANYSPNLLCNYLYDLAQKYNSFYNKDKIIGGENEEFRLALTAATGQVLKNGLKILGIQAPERM